MQPIIAPKRRWRWKLYFVGWAIITAGWLIMHIPFLGIIGVALVFIGWAIGCVASLCGIFWVLGRVFSGSGDPHAELPTPPGKMSL
jgi:hypothetical protein